MTRNLSPSARWTRSHGRKVLHQSITSAQEHAEELNQASAAGEVPDHYAGGVWEPYPCNWGQDYRDGETAPGHWHVGRTGRRTEALTRKRGSYR